MTIPTIRSLRRNVTRNVPRVASLLAIFSLGFSMSVPAQDLAEIARQERAKRDAQPQHVYTNDDLKQDKILTPEDRKRAEADKAPAPGSSAAQSAAAAPAAPPPADVADAAVPKSAAEESLGDFARRVLALKAQQDRIKKEREARLRNQLPLELPPPELMRPPSLAYPMFPEPSVKPPLQPALVAPRRLSPFAKDVPAPTAPLARSAANSELTRPLGGLAVPPPAPWAPLASAHSRARLEASAPPAVPTARLVAPQLAGNLASLPVAPVSASTAPSSRHLRGTPAAPAVPSAPLVAPQLAGNLASPPVVPLRGSMASPTSPTRPLRSIFSVPVVPSALPFSSQLAGDLASLPVAPVSASAAPSSRPLRGVPAVPAVPSVRFAAPALPGELASLPAAPVAAVAVSPSPSRRSWDIPSPPAIPLTRPALTPPPEGVLALPITPPARRRNRAANDAGDGVVPGDGKARGSYEGIVRVIPVHPGDTLWQLSRKYLGRALDWPVLAAANPQLADPSRLLAGTWIALPETSAEATNVQVRVQAQPGDSLSLLAREHLGASAAWRCVAEANPKIKNPNLIFVGQTVTIPESCTATEAPAAAHVAPVAELSTHSYLR